MIREERPDGRKKKRRSGRVREQKKPPDDFSSECRRRLGEKKSVEASAIAVEKEIWNDDDGTRKNVACEETSNTNTDKDTDRQRHRQRHKQRQPPTTSHTHQ